MTHTADTSNIKMIFLFYCGIRVVQKRFHYSVQLINTRMFPFKLILERIYEKGIPIDKLTHLFSRITTSREFCTLKQDGPDENILDRLIVDTMHVNAENLCHFSFK